MIKKRGGKAFLSEKHPSNFKIKVLHQVVIKIKLHEQRLGKCRDWTCRPSYKYTVNTLLVFPTSERTRNFPPTIFSGNFMNILRIRIRIRIIILYEILYEITFLRKKVKKVLIFCESLTIICN